MRLIRRLYVYTLTANPAVDMTVAGPALVPDENVRANSASYTANGKGLDVSFALKKNFGVDSVALGFLAASPASSSSRRP